MARLPLSPAALILAREGVAMREIAEPLGVSPVTVSRWLSGQHAPPREQLALVLRAVLGSADLADDVIEAMDDQATDREAVAS